jgi:23S rRNA (cytosine1962-C5)-methyltransferase
MWRSMALTPARATFLDADVNASLRAFIEKGRTFDAIVLDPPKLAPTAAHAERAARAYKDINRLAFKLLEPGGVLFTYSCSGASAPTCSTRSWRRPGWTRAWTATSPKRLGGAPDHPMTINFPEGEYLKGLVDCAQGMSATPAWQTLISPLHSPL